MLSYKRWVKSVINVVLKPYTNRAVTRLCNEIDEDSRLLGTAIKETLQNDLTSQEKKWVTRIEGLRKELNSSTTEISIIDFGAGDRSVKYSGKDVVDGRHITRTIGTVCKNASKPYTGSLLLFKLIKNFKPNNCIELGTCLGISASYQAAALKINNAGRLITLEGSNVLATFAEQHFLYLGLDNVQVVTGRFQDTLELVLKTNGPIDFIFIDGHHDEKATEAYYKQTIPFLNKKSLLVFDDISWSQGMKRAWENIHTDERINISVDLQQIGVCIINNGLHSQKHMRIPLI